MIERIRMALRTPSLTTPPPGVWEPWRNDLMVLAVVAFAFFLGFGLRNQALTASKRYQLGPELPTLHYPAGWITGASESVDFQASNPASPSTFDAQVAVVLRETNGEQTLDIARAAWAIRRSRELLFYRELAAQPVTVLGETPALLTRYGYVADPVQASGGEGLPVVVQGEDLLFVQGDHLIVISTAADATEWADADHHFALVWQSLALEHTAVPPTAIPTEQAEDTP
jgi:hypothetical protein